MSGHNAVIETLREAGYRLTPQRLMVLQAIAESQGHQTADAIHQEVVKTYPYLDIATVYRILQLLKRLHLVTEIDLGGNSARYEVAEPNKHHHMVCNKCGLTFDLSPSYLCDQQSFSFCLNSFSFSAPSPVSTRNLASSLTWSTLPSVVCAPIASARLGDPGAARDVVHR